MLSPWSNWMELTANVEAAGLDIEQWMVIMMQSNDWILPRVLFTKLWSVLVPEKSVESSLAASQKCQYVFTRTVCFPRVRIFFYNRSPCRWISFNLIRRERFTFGMKKGFQHPKLWSMETNIRHTSGLLLVAVEIRKHHFLSERSKMST